MQHDVGRRRAAVNFMVEALELNVQLSRETLAVFEALNTRCTKDTSGEVDMLGPVVLPPKKPKDKQRIYYLKIPWRRAELKEINLDQLLRREDVESLHPLPEMAAATRISYKLNKPVGLQLSNYAVLSRSPELRANHPPAVSDPRTCPCQKWKSASSLSDEGHVVSADPGSIEDQLVGSLWPKGMKYRCKFHLASVFPAIGEGVDESISSC